MCFPQPIEVWSNFSISGTNVSTCMYSKSTAQFVFHCMHSWIHLRKWNISVNEPLSVLNVLQQLKVAEIKFSKIRLLLRFPGFRDRFDPRFVSQANWFIRRFEIWIELQIPVKDSTSLALDSNLWRIYMCLEAFGKNSVIIIIIELKDLKFTEHGPSPRSKREQGYNKSMYCIYFLLCIELEAKLLKIIHWNHR